MAGKSAGRGPRVASLTPGEIREILRTSGFKDVACSRGHGQRPCVMVKGVWICLANCLKYTGQFGNLTPDASSAE